ncbi:MAG: DUF4349 domain-containing protein, partial [Anaerolineaceae bacterium]|nr:DUF4349 domain-containing protein [Anaerolineaceae bacterium]
MLKRSFLVFIFIILLAVSGCASSAIQSEPMMAPGAPSMDMAAEESAKSEGFAGDFGSGTNAANSPSSAPDQRIVIRNASLTIVVADPGKSLDAIGKMAEAMGGFIVTSDLHKTYTRNGTEIPEATLTVRVPAEKLTEALTEIKKQVNDPQNDVRAENISGQDVTKEYTDLNSQLKNYEDAEAQLREIMASATKTEDVLAIFQQLTQVRQQIEVLKGQIQYYKESAALSAITVQIQAQAAVQPLEVGGWKPVGVAKQA